MPNRRRGLAAAGQDAERHTWFRVSDKARWHFLHQFSAIDDRRTACARTLYRADCSIVYLALGTHPPPLHACTDCRRIWQTMTSRRAAAAARDTARRRRRTEYVHCVPMQLARRISDVLGFVHAMCEDDRQVALWAIYDILVKEPYLVLPDMQPPPAPPQRVVNLTPWE